MSHVPSVSVTRRDSTWFSLASSASLSAGVMPERAMPLPTMVYRLKNPAACSRCPAQATYGLLAPYPNVAALCARCAATLIECFAMYKARAIYRQAVAGAHPC